MTDKDHGSSDDHELFGRAAAGARPLAQDRRPPFRPRVPPQARQRQRDEQVVLQSLLSDGYDEAEVETGDELVFLRSGVSQLTWRRLRRGYYAIEAELDLHGCVVADARERVAAFLREAQGAGRRCVRIVHGKGLSSAGRLPILKVKVNHWLQQKDVVLAFCSARPVDGGTGAAYVLLRRNA